jgi:hypothetical protein
MSQFGAHQQGGWGQPAQGFGYPPSYGNPQGGFGQVDYSYPSYFTYLHTTNYISLCKYTVVKVTHRSHRMNGKENSSITILKFLCAPRAKKKKKKSLINRACMNKSFITLNRCLSFLYLYIFLLFFFVATSWILWRCGMSNFIYSLKKYILNSLTLQAQLKF